MRFQAVTRDPAAWPELMAALDLELLAMARHQRIGRLRDNEDSPREIVAAVYKRMHANDHAFIKRLCALEPRPDLQAWLRVVVRRAAIDYMRTNPEFARAENRWISLATLTSSAPGVPADSLVEKRAEVVRALREMVDAWPFLQATLANLEMVLAKSDMAIAGHYLPLVEDQDAGRAIFGRIRSAWQGTRDCLLQDASIRLPLPYIEPLNSLQIELLKPHRAGEEDDRIREGIQLSINAIATALRNSG